MKKDKKESILLGFLSIILGFLSFIPLIGILFAIASIVLGTIHIKRGNKRFLGFMGVILSIIAIITNIALGIYIFNTLNVYNPRLSWHEVDKSDELLLSSYFPDFLNDTNLKITSFETIYSSYINLSSAGNNKEFFALVRDRVWYGDSSNFYKVKVWVELVPSDFESYPQQFSDYKKDLIESISPTVLAEERQIGVNSITSMNYYIGNHSDIHLSYFDKDFFDKSEEEGSIGISQIFFKDKEVAVTIIFLKSIGINYEEASKNMEKFVKEFALEGSLRNQFSETLEYDSDKKILEELMNNN